MFEYFLIFVKIRFINFARFGLQTAANLTLAKLNLIRANLTGLIFIHQDPRPENAKFGLVKFSIVH